tara:strand:- start:2898 stop:3071 length:174 start_codon:yes stop_codon:yes gene_type:complete
MNNTHTPLEKAYRELDALELEIPMNKTVSLLNLLGRLSTLEYSQATDNAINIMTESK